MSSFKALFGVQTNDAPTLTGPISLQGSVRAQSIAVPALNIDCSLGNYFKKTVAANSAFTFSNVPPAGTVYTLRLDISLTGGTFTFPASVRNPGVAPTYTLNRRHKVFLTTDDGGLSWDLAAQTDYPL